MILHHMISKEKLKPTKRDDKLHCERWQSFVIDIVTNCCLVKSVGTKSQLWPKICFEGSPHINTKDFFVYILVSMQSPSSCQMELARWIFHFFSLLPLQIWGGSSQCNYNEEELRIKTFHFWTRGLNFFENFIPSIRD